MKGINLYKVAIIAIAGVLIVLAAPLKAEAADRLLDVKNVKVLEASETCETGYIWIDIDGSTTQNAGDECWMGIFIKNGKVGIGTTSPAQELQVEAATTPTIRIQDTGSGYGEIVVADGDLLLKADDGNAIAGSEMRFNVDGTNNMIIKSGNVGIGTVSPGAKLHISDASDAKIKLETGTNWITIAPDSAGTAWAQFNTSMNRYYFNKKIMVGGGMIGSLSGDLFLQPAQATKMTITTSGNVGIGTTNPTATLEVNGNAIISNMAGTENNAFACVNSSGELYRSATACN